jgi:2-C-methyl-D-erythritol 4-phosphate cytidylyltransferase
MCISVAGVQEAFQKYYDDLPAKPPLRFAEPGKERQDSVYNGFVVGCALLHSLQLVTCLLTSLLSRPSIALSALGASKRLVAAGV